MHMQIHAHNLNLHIENSNSIRSQNYKICKEWLTYSQSIVQRSVFSLGLTWQLLIIRPRFDPFFFIKYYISLYETTIKLLKQ